MATSIFLFLSIIFAYLSEPCLWETWKSAHTVNEKSTLTPKPQIYLNR